MNEQWMKRVHEESNRSSIKFHCTCYHKLTIGSLSLLKSLHNEKKTISCSSTCCTHTHPEHQNELLWRWTFMMMEWSTLQLSCLVRLIVAFSLSLPLSLSFYLYLFFLLDPILFIRPFFQTWMIIIFRTQQKFFRSHLQKKIIILDKGNVFIF